VEDEFTDWAAGVQRRLLRSAYLLTGDLHRAEDLVQEALVKVALRWARLRDGNPTAYARTVIVRDNISWWRRQREVPTPTPRDLAQVSSDPETALVVRRALDRLTPKQRAVVVLRHFDDLSEHDTAVILGVSVGTVKSQTSDALAALRRALADAFGAVVAEGEDA
jgi:RNA polymerase sigma-70 factor (sigma-E family)